MKCCKKEKKIKQKLKGVVRGAAVGAGGWGLGGGVFEWECVTFKFNYHLNI